jgi:hypothetical protein
MEEAAPVTKRAVSIRKVATQLRFCGNQSLFPLIGPVHSLRYFGWRDGTALSMLMTRVISSRKVRDTKKHAKKETGTACRFGSENDRMDNANP